MKFSKSTASKKAVSFYSYHLNKEKLNTIKAFARKNQNFAKSYFLYLF